MTGSLPPSPGKPSNVGALSANAIIHDDDRSTVAKTRPRPVAKSGRKTGLVFALAGAIPRYSPQWPASSLARVGEREPHGAR